MQRGDLLSPQGYNMMHGPSIHLVPQPQPLQDLQRGLAYEAAWLGPQSNSGDAIPRGAPPPPHPFGSQGYPSLVPENSTASAQYRGTVGASELYTDYSKDVERGAYEEEDNRNLEDVWIAVMGVTGSGKSSFIELCTGQNVGVGHNLASFTYEVEEYQFVYENTYRIHLIDTPGFDDTKRTDTDVLRDISTWLGESYSKDVKLSGILYLHPISHNRMTGTARRNLFMFKKLIGENAFDRVVLATTMWEGVKPEDGLSREEELKNTPDFWGAMMAKGSKIMRHTHNDRDSATQVLRWLLHRKEKVVLEIQKEMVDERLDLDQTGAGRQINKDIIALQEKHKKDLESLAKEKEEAINQRDSESAEAIRELEEKTKREIEEANKARESLRVNMEMLREQQEQQIEQLREKYSKELQEWNSQRLEFEAWKSQSDLSDDKAHMDELLRLEQSGSTLLVRSKKIRQKKRALELMKYLIT